MAELIKPYLCSTFDDPGGVFLDDLGLAVRKIMDHFSGWSVNVTERTDAQVKARLRELGVVVTETDPEELITPSKIETDHLKALKGGINGAEQTGAHALAYVDADRAILAAVETLSAANDPDAPDFLKEFTESSELIPQTEEKVHVNIRREALDYLTHPYFDTELEINRLCSKAFGGPVDVVSTAHMMSVQSARDILDASPEDEPLDFPHLKWDILSSTRGARFYSREIKGLPFETPYQFRGELNDRINAGEIDNIAKEAVDPGLSDYNAVGDAYGAILLRDPVFKGALVGPGEQGLRYRTVDQYLGYLERHVNDPLMQDEIRSSREGMRKRGAATIEGLQRPLAETMQLVGRSLREPPEPSAPRIMSVSPARGERR